MSYKDAADLMAKFKKGSAFFNRELAAGRDNPWLRRKIARFEQDVVIPLDMECVRLTDAERKTLL